MRAAAVGIDCNADVRAENVALSDHGVSFALDGVAFESSLIGRHSVLNILAGMAVASLYGIRLAQLIDGRKQASRSRCINQTIWA